MKIKNKKIAFITGASGFLGQHVVSAYLKNDWQVIGYDIVRPNIEDINLVFISGNIGDTEKLRLSLTQYKPSIVLHLASLLKASSSQTLFDVNVHGMHSVCSAIVSSGLNVTVNSISSSAVYKPSRDKIGEQCQLQPITHYGLSKMLQEDILTNYSMRGYFNHLIFRPFNLIGPGMPINLSISGIIDRLKFGKNFFDEKINVGNIESIRDYIDVRDAANIIYNLSSSGINKSGVINVCSGTGFKLQDILKICCDKLDYHPEFCVDASLLQSNDVPYQVGCTERLHSYYQDSLRHDIADSIESMLAIDLQK